MLLNLIGIILEYMYTIVAYPGQNLIDTHQIPLRKHLYKCGIPLGKILLTLIQYHLEDIYTIVAYPAQNLIDTHRTP